MHVILKPFIKLAIMLLAVLGIAEIAGVDVEEIINQLMGYINGGDDTTTDPEEESSEEA